MTQKWYPRPNPQKKLPLKQETWRKSCYEDSFLSTTPLFLRPGKFCCRHILGVKKKCQLCLRIAGCWMVKENIWSHRFPSAEAYHGTKVTWNPKKCKPKKHRLLLLTWLAGSFELVKVPAIPQKSCNQEKSDIALNPPNAKDGKRQAGEPFCSLLTWHNNWKKPQVDPRVCVSSSKKTIDWLLSDEFPWAFWDDHSLKRSMQLRTKCSWRLTVKTASKHRSN